jgi:predicted Zn-dependent protease with MMP-like domain
MARDMDNYQFESIVVKAIEALPEEFREKLENVDVIVEDWPSAEQLQRLNIRHRSQLLGLYEGVPHIQRGRSYGMVLPDKITIFKKPIEMRYRTDREIETEIGNVVRHEIAHHFGTDEKTLREIEEKYRK